MVVFLENAVLKATKDLKVPKANKVLKVMLALNLVLRDPEDIPDILE
jgi:hypothetical protein